MTELSDYDFPCSYDFRSYVEHEITGKGLPAIKEPVEMPPLSNLNERDIREQKKQEGMKQVPFRWSILVDDLAGRMKGLEIYQSIQAKKEVAKRQRPGYEY